MSSFFVPNSNPPVPVNLNPPGLSQSQLLSFPAFKIWLSTLQHSLSRQSTPSHEFHGDPYVLRKIDVQSVDFFGGNRVGFVKLQADVSNDNGEKLPGSVFLRGGSVGMLLILQREDIPQGREDDAYVILTVQPRIPAGSLGFAELPAGMLDDSGTFSGKAASEIDEETGLSISQDELIDLTALTAKAQREQTSESGSGSRSGDLEDEKLQEGVYPSPGGSDEFIPLFFCRKRMSGADIERLQGCLTGLRDHGEKITLKLVPLNDLWREAMRDGKALAAWALYQGLKDKGLI